jgi:hypothetical protein
MDDLAPPGQLGDLRPVPGFSARTPGDLGLPADRAVLVGLALEEFTTAFREPPRSPVGIEGLGLEGDTPSEAMAALVGGDAESNLEALARAKGDLAAVRLLAMQAAMHAHAVLEALAEEAGEAGEDQGKETVRTRVINFLGERIRVVLK